MHQIEVSSYQVCMQVVDPLGLFCVKKNTPCDLSGFETCHVRVKGDMSLMTDYTIKYSKIKYRKHIFTNIHMHVLLLFHTPLMHIYVLIIFLYF